MKPCAIKPPGNLAQISSSSVHLLPPMGKNKTPMNTKNINDLNALQATQECLTANKTLVKDVASIVRAAAELDTLIAAILAAQRQQAIKEGLTDEKSAAKNTLAEEAHTIAALAHAGAVENQLDAIARRTDLSFSDVQAGTEAEFVDRCKGVLADAKTVLAEVESCEITAAQIKSLENAIKGFESVKPKPRAGVAVGKNATQQLPVLIRRAKQLLSSRVDRLMVPFKKSDPDFYGEYRASRKIVNQAATRASAKVKLVQKSDALTADKTKAA